MTSRLWGLVLVGSHTGGPAGSGIPPQFRSNQGRPSIVEETIARLASLFGAPHAVVVVTAAQRAYLAGRTTLGPIVVQPSDRGPAASLLLGLASILETDPEALVAVTPSNQTIQHRDEFHLSLKAAATPIRAGDADVVLFGLRPTAQIGGNLWIAPTPNSVASGMRIARVDALLSGLSEAETSRLAQTGLINTRVFVAKGSALVELYRKHQPGLLEVVQHAQRLRGDARRVYLQAEYPSLPSVDLFSDLLAHARNLAVYTWPTFIGWNDLDEAARAQTWLDHEGTARPSVSPAASRTTWSPTRRPNER